MEAKGERRLFMTKRRIFMTRQDFDFGRANAIIMNGIVYGCAARRSTVALARARDGRREGGSGWMQELGAEEEWT